MDCLFCKILDGEIEGDIVFENDRVIIIKDINPRADIHLLAIPKKHISTINDLSSDDLDLVGHMILVAKNIAQEKNFSDKGYKLLFNVGEGGGQVINHIHLHILSGNIK